MDSSPAPSAPPSGASNDAKMWSMLCHLSALAGFLIPLGNIIGPLIIWQMKKNEYPQVDDQGKESLNFQITVLIAVVVCLLLMLVVIGAFLLPIVGLGTLILVIIAGLKANEGVLYRYPVNLRLIK
jgi:uncharacterized protein